MFVNWLVRTRQKVLQECTKRTQEERGNRSISIDRRSSVTPRRECRADSAACMKVHKVGNSGELMIRRPLSDDPQENHPHVAFLFTIPGCELHHVSKGPSPFDPIKTPFACSVSLSDGHAYRSPIPRRQQSFTHLTRLAICSVRTRCPTSSRRFGGRSRFGENSRSGESSRCEQATTRYDRTISLPEEYAPWLEA